MAATAPASTRVAFIGIGVMGRSMAINLLKAGYPLTAYSRNMTPRVQEVLAAGASWAPTITEAVKGASVVATMVGYPADVEQVYLTEGSGILATAAPGTLLIDFTTTKPTLACKIAAAAAAKGLEFLDAPVSGGDVGARNAALSIMVGGERASFERATPLFGCLGKTLVLQGPSGSGQHTKMCNQIAIASGMIGVMESLLYAKTSGLDPEEVLRSISTGAAASWSLSNLVPRVLRGDYAPGFFVEHFVKDMRIAAEECERMGLQLPGLRLALQLYSDLEKDGGAKHGTQALFLQLEKVCHTK